MKAANPATVDPERSNWRGRLGNKTLHELLRLALAVDDEAESVAEGALDAIHDDLEVMWRAQQAAFFGPDDLGLFITRIQGRVEVTMELLRRERLGELDDGTEEDATKVVPIREPESGKRRG